MDPIFERFCAGSMALPVQLQDALDLHRVISREEQLYRFGTAAYALYWQAERARKLAISWRHFCVGCAVWAFRADASRIEDRWRVLYGMNTKVEQSGRNICAEPIPLNTALGCACTEIIGMVIVGNPQEDERGITPPTLRPCVHCRTLMKHHPLITPETIIVTALPPPGPIESLSEVTYEVHTFRELLNEYGEA